MMSGLASNIQGTQITATMTSSIWNSRSPETKVDDQVLSSFVLADLFVKFGPV